MAVINNPEDRKKIKDALVEISNSLTRVDAEKDLIKEIVADVSEKYGLKKRAISKLAKAYHKQSFNDEVAENEEFVELYESVLDTK